MRWFLIAVVVVGLGAAFDRSESTAAAASKKKDLVLIGTVFSISQGGDELRPWIVTVDVEKVISGELSGGWFSFPVHSPSRAGLEEGKSYTIRAVWKGDGYAVDELQWRRPAKVGRLSDGPLRGAAEPRVAADRAAPGR
ncbi:MAG TPA: hypothetical protein VHO06_04415 [Polyangia bacterium]|nr:hypothetical protein [Polyangia bacterium]